MKFYKKPIAAWFSLAAISVFGMTSTGADYLDFPEPVTSSELIATSSDAIIQTKEPINEPVEETKEEMYELGWNNTENGYLYISATGVPLIETWISDAQGRYYIGKNGIMFFDGIRRIKDKEYCFDKSGNVQTGRFWYDGIEYYASNTGQLYSDEWILSDEDIWYYISGNGEILKDSVTPDGYLLDMDGHIITEEDELSKAFHYVSDNSNRELILKAKTGQIIWDFLKEEGWTDTAIAGVLGNFQQESGLTADMHQRGGGTGYGLGQWTGGRRYALESYAENTGQDVTQLMTQLNYLIIEPGEQNFVRQYSKTDFNSPSEAALAWARGWERYNEDGSIYRVRIPYAEAYYAYFVNGEEFVVAKEPDNIILAENPELLACSTSDNSDITLANSPFTETVSESESVEEITLGYGPAFDPDLNPDFTSADVSPSAEYESQDGTSELDIPHGSVLTAETSLESYIEEEIAANEETIEETQPENYGPGYTTEAETINQENIEESIQ